MRNLAVLVLAFTISVCSVRASLAADTDRTEYIAVDSVAAFDKRGRGKDNIPPWVRATAGKEKSPPGTTQVIVSNACGPVEFIYLGLSPDDYVVANRNRLVEQKTLVYLGEWCRVGEYAFDSPTLVRLRNWNGVRYVTSSTRIYRDGNARPYIADIGFIERAGWLSLKKTIDPLATWVCVKPEQIASDKLTSYRKNAWLKETAEGYCHSHGVYLVDTLTSPVVSPDKDDAP